MATLAERVTGRRSVEGATIAVRILADDPLTAHGLQALLRPEPSLNGSRLHALADLDTWTPDPQGPFTALLVVTTFADHTMIDAISRLRDAHPGAGVAEAVAGVLAI
jgi:hypothetical protein